MRKLVLVFSMLIPSVLWSQDLGGTSFSIPAVPRPKTSTPTPTPKPEEPKTKTPGIFDAPPSLPGSIEYKPSINMSRTSDFINPGDRVADKLNNEDLRDPHLRSKRDQYFGEIKTKSKKIIISCRDTQAVDGDMVSIKVNGNVIRQALLLEGEYRNIEIFLEPYTNTVVFEALNEGMSPPNTAAFLIIDEEGNHLFSDSWNISTGFKASINIFRN